MTTCAAITRRSGDPQPEPHAQNSMQQARRIKALLVPPEQWNPERQAFKPGEAPDPFAIYEAMSVEGVDVTLLDPHGWPLNPVAKFHPLYGGLDPCRVMQIWSRRNRFDLLLSVFESSCMFPLLLRRLGAAPPKVAMWDIVPDEEWKARRVIQDIVVPRIDRLFLLATSQQAYLRQRWNRDIPSTVVWQHMDTDFFRPGRRNPDGPILAIGEDHGRDWDTFIEAISDLDCEVLIKTKRELPLHRVRKARVTQLRDRLSYAELRALYDRCRFVVIPLKTTLNVSGVGSLLESMAMGKASVISDNPPMRDYFKDGETAIVTKVGDVDALRNGIERLVADPDMAMRMGDNAREFAESKFSNRVFGKRLAAAIRRLVIGGQE